MVSDLVVVTVKTKQGSEYSFPDVPRSMIETVIKNQGWGSAGSVVVVNISGACLTMPARIVDTLCFDGEVKWTGSPA
jgi:hypothetical protein